MSGITYPLKWLFGFPRSQRRENGQFRTALDNAVANVKKSLKAFSSDSNKAITDPVLTANIDFMDRLQGGDPGVAIWFTWDGIQICIPVDRYLSVASNLQAIHHIIEARRVELRHGTLALVRATFEGFRALPSPKSPWEILGIVSGSSAEAVKSAYSALAKKAHPDAGGSTSAMAEINRARDDALREIGAR